MPPTMRKEHAVRGAPLVPFTREKPKEKTKGKIINFPESLFAYIEKAGSGREGGASGVVLNAVAFDRDLGEKTAHLQERLDAFAAAMHLLPEHQAAELAARLIERGLESWEAEQGKKPKR